MKTLHLSIITGILLASIAIILVVYMVQQNPSVRFDVKTPSQPQNSDVYWASNVTQQIVMGRWDTKVIPVQIFSKQDKPLTIKLGVTVPFNQDYLHTGDTKLPFGIFTSLDKNAINLNATTQQGFVVRDTTKMTISTLPFIGSGTYKLVLVLYQDNGMSSARIFTLKIV